VAVEHLSPWRPTASLVRACASVAVLGVLAVVSGRPDLLVLAAPLLLHAVVALARRPDEEPHATTTLGTDTLREGEGTTLAVELTPAAAVEQVLLAVRPHRWLVTQPAGGVVARHSPPGEDPARAELSVASLRWGRREASDGLVGGLSSWAGFEWGPVAVPPRPVTTLPVPGPFDSRAASPHPIGLVGVDPARRRGDGYEFESIRPFRPGDRLRRVQWRVSLRSGSLHVTSTQAEEDSSILLLVDSGIEIGVSGGVHGAPSSLDVAVRAAGAIAEHYLARGDRVGLRVLGSTSRTLVPTSAGRLHLRRVLETLARVVPGENRDLDPERMRFDVRAGTVVLVFSPMLSQVSVTATTKLASRGLDVVVVDCLPDDVDLGRRDPHLATAWRMRLLERRALLERAERHGIPVVPWRGPGTLDEVLRRLRRRAATPVVGRR
jgi:uncharacterized protein (DUF58 family)